LNLIKQQATNKTLKNTYFHNLWYGIKSSWIGLKLSVKHIWEARKMRKPLNISDKNYFKQSTGIVTLQYPYEAIPVPDNGRYRLHNEMDDCIVCDKCAKICPVDCIEIEPIKATEQVGVTSDGSPIRLYAAKFDIDMAKCCYCGLCTTVCPTECLTMTKAYDYSEFEISNMIYHFSNLTPEQAKEKMELLVQFQKEKAELKQSTQKSNEQFVNTKSADNQIITESPKPIFKPKVKTISKTENIESESQKIDNQEVEEVKAEQPQATENQTLSPKAKPVFKPKVKTVPKTENIESESQKIDNQEVEEVKAEKSQATENQILSPKTKPVFKPKVKTVPKTENIEPESQKIDNQEIKLSLEEEANAKGDEGEKNKTKFIPKTKPIIKPKKE
jgi:NADH-quinone oxidoreductase subunit I